MIDNITFADLWPVAIWCLGGFVLGVTGRKSLPLLRRLARITPTPIDDVILDEISKHASEDAEKEPKDG